MLVATRATPRFAGRGLCFQGPTLGFCTHANMTLTPELSQFLELSQSPLYHVLQNLQNMFHNLLVGDTLRNLKYSYWSICFSCLYFVMLDQYSVCVGGGGGVN